MSHWKQIKKLKFSFLLSKKSFYYPTWRKWKEIVETSPLEDMKQYQNVMELWKSRCTLYNNRHMRLLGGIYGGLGEYPDEDFYKQLIIRKNFEHYMNIEENYDDITMDIINGTGDIWSVYELDDLIEGFIAATLKYNKDWEADIIEGYIEAIDIKKFRI